MTTPDRSTVARSEARTDDLRRVLPPALSDPARPGIARALDDEYVRRAASRADDREVRRYRRLTASDVEEVAS